jgi:3'-phosphoadenosine 5'-phosphosulfate (PAPS) 3'-phosphatase
MTDLDLDGLRDELEGAVAVAAEAILAVLDRGQIRVGHKWGEGPVTEADYAADEALHRSLMPLIPGAQWLSEESEQVAPLIHGEPTWVVDPLDGTREFLRGLPEFGVTVGLFVDDRLVLGAIALPISRDVYSGVVSDGRREARKNRERLPELAVSGEVRRVVVSRHDFERRRLHTRFPFETYPAGSAALKLLHAADGTADAYLSTGPRSIWDVAGGAAILEGAGGTLLTANGRPLVLSPRDVHVPPYVAGEREACLTVLRGIGQRV